MIRKEGFCVEEILRNGLRFLRISSENGEKDLELCFLENGAGAVLESLAFGDFEWDYPMGAEELGQRVRQVTSGKLWVIHTTNRTTGTWINTEIYDETQETEFQERIGKLEMPPDPGNAYLLRRHASMVHQVYNWKEYRWIR